MAEAKPLVRFCEIASSSSTGADSDASRYDTFLLYDTYAFNKWNSTLESEDANEGCWSKIRTNRTDIYHAIVQYPKHYEVLRYFTLIRDGKFIIMSSKVPVIPSVAQTESTDSLSPFTSFSVPVAAVIILFLVVFYALFKYCCTTVWRHETVTVRLFRRVAVFAKLTTWERGRKRSRAPGKLVIGMLMKQFSACDGTNARNVTFKMILILFILFLSYLHLMFVCSEKTELVVLDRPFIFDSYQKIIDHPQAYPMWLWYEDGNVAFMRSKRGSLRYRLWTKARQRCPQNPKGCLAHMNADNVVAYLTRISEQKLVLVVSDFAARFMNAGLCPLAEMMFFNPITFKYDASEEAIPFGLGYSRFLEQSLPQVAAFITNRGKKTFESGIILKLIIPTKSHLNALNQESTLRRCLNPEEFPEDLPLIRSKPWTDYWSLLLICASVDLLALVIHMASKTFSRCQRSHRSPRSSRRQTGRRS